MENLLELADSPTRAIKFENLSDEEYQEWIFEFLKPIATALVKTFTPLCEVVLHDLSDLEHSIIWIEGDVTGRKIRGSITDLGLSQLRLGENQKDMYNYRTETKNGKILKSSSVMLRDRNDKVFGALCINFDITSLESSGYSLRGFCMTENDVLETFADEPSEILSDLIEAAFNSLGKPLTAMKADDKLKVVAFLDEKGAFFFRNGVRTVAEALGLSRATIYNYRKTIRSRS